MKLKFIIPLLFLVFSSFNKAYSDNSEIIANQIYTEVFSPFCPGRSLKDCPSSKAEKLKLEILEKLNSGNSKKEVLENVYKKYGEEYRALPKITGFSGLAWIIPLLFLFTGLFIFLLTTKKSKSKSEIKSKKIDNSFEDIDKLL